MSALQKEVGAPTVVSTYLPSVGDKSIFDTRSGLAGFDDHLGFGVIAKPSIDYTNGASLRLAMNKNGSTQKRTHATAKTSLHLGQNVHVLRANPSFTHTRLETQQAVSRV